MKSLNKLKEKYENWSSSPIKYNFNRTLFFVSVIYCICTFYDLSLTYITFKLSPDGFFMYEISFIIKKAYGGDAFFCILCIVFFILPLIVAYGFSMYSKKYYSGYVNGLRVVLFAIWSISFLHIIGGLTNFFYLINM